MKKIDYPREQLSVRLELDLAKAFKIALITRNQTAGRTGASRPRVR